MSQPGSKSFAWGDVDVYMDPYELATGIARRVRAISTAEPGQPGARIHGEPEDAPGRECGVEHALAAEPFERRP